MWSEWDYGNMVANAAAFLPVTSTSPAFLGDYAATDGPFPNPVTTTAITSQTFHDFAGQWEIDVRQSQPGDLGLMRYYPNMPGPLQNSNVGYISWSRIEDSWAEYKLWYDAYSTKVTAYETLRDEYNTALAGDLIRRTSPLALFFPEATGLP